MRAKLLTLATLVGLLSSCDDGGVKPYEGKSAHWNQEEVPISLQCAACHRKEFEQWAGSDHAWAWRPLDASLDSQPFHGQKLAAHGSELRFRTERDGTLMLEDGETGKSFKVHSVLGRTPLIQYLVEAQDGGLHTPSAAWDTIKLEWFDMFEDDERLANEELATRSSSDWGHWLGRGMNWNSQCAWCHMSGFRKNYDAATDTYQSTWQEPGVSCIQCHKLADKPDPKNGCLVAKADRKLTRRQIHDNCATCHARREELNDQFQVGNAFEEHFRLELPTIQGVFWPNGMQRDEAYCETGLRHSRMGRARVNCIDCHDPHSAQLKLPQEDNSLCLRCHATGTVMEESGVKAPIISAEMCSPCPKDSKGARCVECHMPESPFMARDPRRDHSFNLPDPELSEELGIPNACIMCHADKSNAWAAAAIEKHWGDKRKRETRRPRTRAIAAAMAGQGNADDLLAALTVEDIPAWQASLLELLSHLPASSDILAAAKKLSNSPEAMVRASAARVLKEEALEMALTDSSRLVRRVAGWPLVDRLVQMNETRTLNELLESANHQADQPSGAMQLAIMAEAHGNVAEAQRQYKRAVALDPSGPVARLDFARFLAAQGRDLEALEQMTRAAQLSPEDAEVHFRLALCYGALSQNEAALSALDEAIRLAPDLVRARYNRAIMLQHLKREAEALAELECCKEYDATNPEWSYFQAVIHYQAGRAQESIKAALEALKADPQHAPSRQLIQTLLPTQR